MSNTSTTPDLIRVLTPINDDNKEMGPGLPAVIGRLDAFLNPSDIPGFGFLKDGFVTDDYEHPDFVRKAKEELNSIIRQAIPDEAIKTDRFVFSDTIFKFDPTFDRHIHLDGELKASYCYTVTAGFPNSTVSFPEEKPTRTLLDGKRTLKVDFNTGVQAKPADVMIFNDNRLIHSAPGNYKTYAQWQEIMKDYPEHHGFLNQDGSIRRLFARSVMVLDKDWVDEVCGVVKAKQIEPTLI